MDEEITCAICQKSLDNVKDVLTLREKESEGINRASTEHNDIIQPAPVIRKIKHAAALAATQLTRAKKEESTISQLSSSRLSLDRTTEQSFNFKTDCFFCETNVDSEEQKRRQGDVFKVATLEAKDTVLQTCSERKDEWTEVVQARILHYFS